MLHSPVQSGDGPGHVSVVTPAINTDSDVSFTEEEVTLFQTRYENGYNITGDDRYGQCPSKHHLDAM